MLSCAQLPLARTPTFRLSHAVPSIEPIQPSRQSAVPAGFKLAAPERPPNAPPRVKRSDQDRIGDAVLDWARSAAGASAATSTAVTRDNERFDMESSTRRKGLHHDGGAGCDARARRAPRPV